VVKVDRSGLNDNHPVVKALYEAVDRVLRPIVAEEEKRAGAHLIRAGSALKARDQGGLRALNDALKTAFDTPGKAAFAPGDEPATKPPAVDDEPTAQQPGESGEPQDRQRQPALLAPLRFKQALVRLHPGERRGATPAPG
jgi:hypothetical protein